MLCAVLLLAAGFAACDSTPGLAPGGPSDSPPDAGPVPMTTLLSGLASLEEGLVLNPSGRTPLAARLRFDTVAPTTVRLEVLGAIPVARAFDAATSHDLPVLGLYPGTANVVAVRVDDAGSDRYALDTLRIETPSLPGAFPRVEILVDAGEGREPGWTLSALSIGNDGRFDSYPLLFDRQGAIRWYLDLSDFNDICFFLRRLANGNYLNGHHQTLYEFDVLGREVNRWQFPGYTYHHDVVEKPDGNFLVAVNKLGLTTVEDHVIEVDRGTGEVVREWDLREVLDVDRFDLVEDEEDWFHMNAIWYDAADDALVLSGRNQGVVKVNGENDLVWILAPHRGWGPAGADGTGPPTADALLTAVDAAGVPYDEAVQEGTSEHPDFAWPWGQHAPMRTADGRLFLFDNGFNRNFGTAAAWSRGVEYEIDEAAMTVRQGWAYGRERGEAFFSRIISDVDVLPATGNRLIMPGVVHEGGPGSYAHVTEVTYPGKSVVYDARIRFRNLNNTGDGWGQIDIVYRSERLPLYPDQVGAAPTAGPRARR